MLARHERNAQGMRHMTTESYSPPTYTTTRVDVSACVSSGWQGRPRALLRAWQHHAAHCCPKSCPACFQPWPCVPEWIPAGVPEVAGDPRTASAEHARLPWLAWLAAVATVGRAAVVTALLVAVGRTAGAVQAAEVEEVAEAEESAAMVAAELVAVATVKQQAARAGGRARGLSPHREPPPCRTPRRSHLPPHHSLAAFAVPPLLCLTRVLLAVLRLLLCCPCCSGRLRLRHLRPLRTARTRGLTGRPLCSCCTRSAPLLRASAVCASRLPAARLPGCCDRPIRIPLLLGRLC